jgi:hypothetical protein
MNSSGTSNKRDSLKKRRDSCNSRNAYNSRDIDTRKSSEGEPTAKTNIYTPHQQDLKVVMKKPATARLLTYR